MRTMKLAAALMLSLAGACCLAQVQKPNQLSPAVSALLQKMRTAYASAKTAKISGTFTQFGDGTQVNLKTETIYRAPNQFHVTTTGLPDLKKDGYVVITDGKQIFMDGLPGGSMARPFTEQNMWQALPQMNLETLCFWDWKQQFSVDRGGNMFRSTFALSAAILNGRSYTVLEENAGNVKVHYFIDPKTSFIWRVETFDKGSRSPYAITTIEKMDIDVPVDDASFVVPSVKR